MQQYTGAIAADFTVIMPNVPKYGFAQNSTTGGHNVILDAGAGTNVTIPADGSLHFYWTDGAGNITLPNTTFGGSAGPIVGTTGTFSGAVSIGGVLTGSSANFTGNVSAANYGAVNGTTGTFSNNVNVAGALGVTGTSTLVGNTGISGNLVVAGNTGIQALTATNGAFIGTLTAGNTGVQAFSATTGVFTSTLQATTGVFTGVLNIAGTAAGSVASAGAYGQAGTSLGFSGPVNFSISAVNSVIAFNFFAISDGRFKTKIEDITDAAALDWVTSGRPVTFVIDGRASAGFIAQDDIAGGRGASISLMEDDRPEVAESDGYAPDGHRLIKNYEHEIAYLTKALQNAIARIEVLEQGL